MKPKGLNFVSSFTQIWINKLSFSWRNRQRISPCQVCIIEFMQIILLSWGFILCFCKIFCIRFTFPWSRILGKKCFVVTCLEKTLRLRESVWAVDLLTDYLFPSQYPVDSPLKLNLQQAVYARPLHLSVVRFYFTTVCSVWFVWLLLRELFFKSIFLKNMLSYQSVPISLPTHPPVFYRIIMDFWPVWCIFLFIFSVKKMEKTKSRLILGTY